MMRAALLAAALVLLAGPASAHGLRLTLTAEPGCLSGRVEYSDGWPGVEEMVVITRLDAPAAPVEVRADKQGRFSAKTPPGRYRVRVTGDEEHEVKREVDVPAGEPRTSCFGEDRRNGSGELRPARRSARPAAAPHPRNAGGPGGAAAA